MSNELYTDDQLLEATGLHIDNVRKLVTWGAVRPAKGGRGRGNVRMWYADTVRHIANVSALVRAGLSLKIAHTITYLDLVSDVYFDVIDPDTIALNGGDKEGWFDPSVPIDPDEDLAWRVVIADGKYVFVKHLRDAPVSPVGVLEENATVFLTAVDYSRVVGQMDESGVERLRPLWETHSGSFIVDPESLAWRYDESIKDLDWQAAYSAAVSITTVNLSLACKIAMRRLLNIPVFFPKPPATEAEGGADPT